MCVRVMVSLIKIIITKYLLFYLTVSKGQGHVFICEYTDYKVGTPERDNPCPMHIVELRSRSV